VTESQVTFFTEQPSHLTALVAVVNYLVVMVDFLTAYLALVLLLEQHALDVAVVYIISALQVVTPVTDISLVFYVYKKCFRKCITTSSAHISLQNLITHYSIASLTSIGLLPLNCGSIYLLLRQS
jgi:hypothetical protein